MIIRSKDFNYAHMHGVGGSSIKHITVSEQHLIARSLPSFKLTLTSFSRCHDLSLLSGWWLVGGIVLLEAIALSANNLNRIHNLLSWR